VLTRCECSIYNLARPASSLLCVRRYEIDAGSNAWVVGGHWTTSGLPLVAGDSHRGLDTPSVYYQIHLVCDDWSVSGYSLPGIPGAPHFSHTEYVGFGMTHGSADYQCVVHPSALHFTALHDPIVTRGRTRCISIGCASHCRDVFIERFRETASGGLEFATETGWLPAEVRSEIIQVKGAEPTSIEVATTRHGPVVEGDVHGQGIGLAACLTGISPDGTKWMDSVLDILRARNADELEEAVAEWTGASISCAYCALRTRVSQQHAAQWPCTTQRCRHHCDLFNLHCAACGRARQQLHVLRRPWGIRVPPEG
jgi:penicillin amidase